ncbi:MAG: hypothetical protein IT454_19070 [Planctomycetes bacterium]|nr:hypothetical protein [Planctomycetota bacterium]
MGRIGRALSSAIASCALALGALAQAPRELLRDCAPDRLKTTLVELRRWGTVGLEECIALSVRGQFEATPAGHEVARATLREQWSTCMSMLRSKQAEPLSTGDLARVLALIGAVGTLEDLPLAVEFAATWPPDEVELDIQQATLAEAATRELALAISGVLARTSARFPSLEDVVGRCPGLATGAVIDAFARCERREALAALARALPSATEHASQIVSAISRAARRVAAPHDAATLRAVRALLDQPQRSGFREALICVGWLEDEESAERLVELLEHPSPGVRVDALWSLRAVTGARFKADAKKWAQWIGGERVWANSRLPSLLEELEQTDAVETSNALNELLRHSFPRHVLAEALARRLGRLQPEAFTAACAALAHLDSRAALPALESLDLGARSESERTALEACTSALRAPRSAPLARR